MKIDSIILCLNENNLIRCTNRNEIHILDSDLDLLSGADTAQSTGAEEYADCISAEE